MMKKYYQLNIEKSTILTFANQVQEICIPLSDYLTINYFSFLRQYKDNSRICLNTNPQWVAHVCEEKLYLKAPFELHSKAYASGYTLWNMLNENSLYLDAYKHFDIDHGLTLIEESADYFDFYHFGRPSTTKTPCEWYLNKLDELQLFTFYFKEKANQLIKNSDILVFPEFKYNPEQDRVKVNNFEDHNNDINFLNSLKINRFYLGGTFSNVYLTPKQVECVKWLVQGKSSREIALIMHTKKRTIDTHIECIKQKLDCVKVSQLSYKLAQTNLASIL